MPCFVKSSPEAILDVLSLLFLQLNSINLLMYHVSSIESFGLFAESLGGEAGPCFLRCPNNSSPSQFEVPLLLSHTLTACLQTA